MSPIMVTQDSNNNNTVCEYVMADIPGKGKGLLAVVDIPPGRMILKERVLVEVKHDQMMKERMVQNKFNLSSMILCWLELLTAVIIAFFALHSWPVIGCSYYTWLVIGCLVVLSYNRIVNDLIETKSFILFHVSWQSLIRQTQSLCKEARSKFESLHNVFPYLGDECLSLLGIFCTNSFQLDQPGKSGVFITASRLNHSCRANCDYFIEYSCIEVRSIRGVPRGTELTICYNNFLEEEGPVSKDERKRYLQWAYRFSCKCEDCSLMGINSRTNDCMRRRVVKLQRDWTLTHDTRHERRIVDELIRTLGKLDSCGKIVNMVHAVECGWET